MDGGFLCIFYILIVISFLFGLHKAKTEKRKEKRFSIITGQLNLAKMMFIRWDHGSGSGTAAAFFGSYRFIVEKRNFEAAFSWWKSPIL
jgi:hypothetical protein